MKIPKLITKREARETAINTIAIGLTASGAFELQNHNWVAGAILIITGALLEYWKYSLRYLGNKIR